MKRLLYLLSILALVLATPSAAQTPQRQKPKTTKKAPAKNPQKSKPAPKKGKKAPAKGKPSPKKSTPKGKPKAKAKRAQKPAKPTTAPAQPKQATSKPKSPQTGIKIDIMARDAGSANSRLVLKFTNDNKEPVACTFYITYSGQILAEQKISVPGRAGHDGVPNAFHTWTGHLPGGSQDKSKLGYMLSNVAKQ